MKLGFYIGVGGVVTFKNGKKLNSLVILLYNKMKGNGIKNV